MIFLQRYQRSEIIILWPLMLKYFDYFQLMEVPWNEIMSETFSPFVTLLFPTSTSEQLAVFFHLRGMALSFEPHYVHPSVLTI